MTTPTPNRLPALLAGGLFAALLVAAPAQADAKLRWKFAKGQKMFYTLTTKTEMTIDAAGQQAENGQMQVMDMTWEVKDVDASGRASMTQTIDRIKLTIEGGPFGKLEFDSADPKEPEGPMAAAAPLFRSMVAAPFELKMSPRGEISDVKVSPKMLEGIKNAGAMAQAAGPMFGEEGLKKMTSQASLVLPEAAIAEGTTWADTKTMELPFGDLVLDNTYTYRGPSASLDKIGVATKLALKPKAGAPIEAKVTSGDGKGSYTFDAAAGVLKASEVVVAMKMEIVAAGQTTLVDSQSTTAMALTRVGAPKSK